MSNIIEVDQYSCETCKHRMILPGIEPCVSCKSFETEGIYKASNWEPKEKNTVDHPSHYNREGAMECIEEMINFYGVDEVMIFCKLNAWKYRYRAGEKNGLEDMKKSDWYIRMYCELKKEKENACVQEVSSKGKDNECD